jgi:hypothetical protein
LDELENAESSKRLFYTASMKLVQEEKRDNQLALMATLAMAVNNPKIASDIMKDLNKKKK